MAEHESIDKIDHSAYDQLLLKYVDKDGMVNYPAWQRSLVDRKELQQDLLRLSQASLGVKAGREGQLAFWINACNAVTLEGILQVYPTSSIRNHPARLVGYSIWKDLPLLAGGQPHSLDVIEHQMLRKMSEPGIHFAIVCASIGCPRLLNEAYVPTRLEDQLTLNATDFFSRPPNFRIDTSGTMHVSSILDWFGEDFGQSQQARFTALQTHLPQDARRLAVNPNARVTYQDYNWSLNGQSAARTSGAGTGPGSSKRQIRTRN